MSHITYNMYLAYVFNKILLFFVQFIYSIYSIIDMLLCCVCCFIMYHPTRIST